MVFRVNGIDTNLSMRFLEARFETALLSTSVRFLACYCWAGLLFALPLFGPRRFVYCVDVTLTIHNIMVNVPFHHNRQVYEDLELELKLELAPRP